MPPGLQAKKMMKCEVCGRSFEEPRITKHQEICEKSIKSKRRPFDSFKQRVQGTVLEQHMEKLKTRLQSQASAKMHHGNWRKTHEEFISTIKAAKKTQKNFKNNGEFDNPNSNESPIKT